MNVMLKQLLLDKTELDKRISILIQAFEIDNEVCIDSIQMDKIDVSTRPDRNKFEKKITTTIKI